MKDKEIDFVSSFENFLLSFRIDKDSKLTRKERLRTLKEINKYLNKYSSKELSQLSECLNSPQYNNTRDLFSLINYKIGNSGKGRECRFSSYATVLVGLENRKSKQRQRSLTIPDLSKLNNKKLIKKLNYYLSKDIEKLDESLMSEVLSRSFSGKQLINLLYMTYRKKKPLYQHKLDLIRSLIIFEIEKRVGKKLEFKESLGPGISRFVAKCNTRKGNLPELFYVLKPDLINILYNIEIRLNFESLDNTDSLSIENYSPITTTYPLKHEFKEDMNIEVSPCDKICKVIRSKIDFTNKSIYFPNNDKTGIFYCLKSKNSSGVKLKYSIVKTSGIIFKTTEVLSNLEVLLLPGKKYFILLNLENLELYISDGGNYPSVTLPDTTFEKYILGFSNIHKKEYINIDDYFGGWEGFQDFLKTTN